MRRPWFRAPFELLKARGFVRLRILRAAWFRAPSNFCGRRGYRLRLLMGGVVSCALRTFAGRRGFVRLRTFEAAWFVRPSNF